VTLHPILRDIITQKELEISNKSNSFSFPSNIPSFYNALSKTKGFIIAECKKASPSSGIIKNDYNPVEIAKIYERMGAAAISVLTDQKFFQGSGDDLKNVFQAVKIPILCKDFILDKIQIHEAKSWGASAILLILRILSDEKAMELYEEATKIDLDVLFEIHSFEEYERVIKLKPKIIGINTRDLDTFQMHPNLIEEIAPKIDEQIIKIAESGIHSKKDLLEHSKYVNGFLIGTYFMKSNHIEDAFLSLTKSENN
jgi:indole-3-glycerol phosphate synthase